MINKIIEDLQNKTLEGVLPVKAIKDYPKGVIPYGGLPLHKEYDNPHVKAFLLLQAHIKRNVTLPCSDYITDTNSVLDQAVRIMQSMIDVSAEKKFFKTTIGIMTALQCVKQGVWAGEHVLMTLPYFTKDKALAISRKLNLPRPNEALKVLYGMSKEDVYQMLEEVGGFIKPEILKIQQVLSTMPMVKVAITGCSPTSSKLPEVPPSTLPNTYTVKANEEYEFKLDVTRQKPISNAIEIRVHLPRFPKVQTEGWFIVLGEKSVDSLACLKRTSIENRGNGQVLGSYGKVKFVAPEVPGIYKYTCFVISDGYRGLDAEVDVTVIVS